MSDKSFGDCPSRNVVKNPLLSTAVTGLSIEDLTHNAVLVPVAANQGLITRSDHQIGTSNQTLGHTDHEFTNFPSGDSNTNVFAPQTIATHHHSLDQHQNIVQHDKKPEISTSTVSKASGKSEDDFDVNEYFARLQGTRYVSAPINSNPDQNANLVAAEENLEEINLNDDKTVEVQQSLTADIAQNFSQLPTVLPHVASAVFSSFSNMLNYKSREQTPDGRQQSYQEIRQEPQGYQSQGVAQNVAIDTPLMAEETVKEVAPPPKEPPTCGTSNYRITTKKKYAQIPGLSSGHTQASDNAFNPPTQNVPSYFIPNVEEHRAQDPVATVAQDNYNIAEQNAPKQHDTYNIFTPVGNSNVKTEQNIPKQHETYNIFNPIQDSNASDNQPNAFNIPKEVEPKLQEERLPPPPTAFAANNTIPPPPMFSSQRRDSQGGKAVLPPSVARRIGSNHPIIKPQIMQSFNTDNIFVPTFDPTATTEASTPASMVQPFSGQQTESSFDIQSYSNQATSQSFIEGPPAGFLSTTAPNTSSQSQFIVNPPSGFGAEARSASSVVPPSITNVPPANLPPSSDKSTAVSAPPMFAPTTTPSNVKATVEPPPMFAPSSVPANVSSTGILPPSSDIFPPIQPSLLLPGPPKPPATGQTSSFHPFTEQSASNVPPTFFNPEQTSQSQNQGTEPPKPLVEPPKSTGITNYRLNKKRPQYYSGPIEGVGSISNSIKPVIPTVDSGSFQGALFTPDSTAQVVPSATPFDISNPVNTTPLTQQFSSVFQTPASVAPPMNLAPPLNVPPINMASQTNVAPQMSIAPPPAFDITQPSPATFDINPPQSFSQQYDTAFDFSRPTSDNYGYKEESKQSSGFGIIGSLKSKLSSIDINKIQNTVTTFFDPAYNETKKDDFNAQQNAPYNTGTFQGQTSQSNLEIFVPNVQQNTPVYNYNYEQQEQHNYDSSQYYKYPNFQNQEQSNAGYCSNYSNYPNSSYSVYATQCYGTTAADTSNLYPPTSEGPTQEFHQEYSGTEPVPKENIPQPIQDKTEANVEKNIENQPALFEPIATKNIQSITSIEEKSAASFFDIQSNIIEPESDSVVDTQDPGLSLPHATHFDHDYMKDTTNLTQESKADPISFFRPEPVELSAKDHTQNKQEVIEDIFANKNLHEAQNVPSFSSITEELFNKATVDRKVDDSQKLFAENKEAFLKGDNIKTETKSVFDSKENVIVKDSLLESLSKDDVPILGVSSVPLFGLSTILADKAKDHDEACKLPSYDAKKTQDILERTSSLSFFDNSPQSEYVGAEDVNILNKSSSYSLFENVHRNEEYTLFKNDDMKSGSTINFFENIGGVQENVDDAITDTIGPEKKGIVEIADRKVSETSEDLHNVSELRICETCREVNKPDDKENDDQDLTTQLIENITSPIQLLNPVEAPLPEAVIEPDSASQAEFDKGQCEDILHITEETIETIQVQSASELLDNVEEIKGMNYGWTGDEVLKPEYSFSIDPNSIGFFGTNKSIFFDKVPSNAEEVKHNEDMLAKQMSIPSAPPAEEEDTKSDEAGVLDVQSIEQDAKKDFPIFEEFVIEPDSNEDMAENLEDSNLDSFTDRVERYKNSDQKTDPEQHKGFFEQPSQPISMASYFDTGNYAAETYYRNNTVAAPSIPPGFEEEFRKRLALAKQKEEEKLKDDPRRVPDTSTQTKSKPVITYTCASNVNYTCTQSTAIFTTTQVTTQPIIPVGFNVEANITSIVDDSSEKSPERETKITSQAEKEQIPIFEPEKVEAKPVSLPEEKKEPKLPDPMNFFADSTPAEAPESFNRLASYFSSPPKTDHAKSFFELSQSQNHYRHATTQNLQDLIKDLTSVQNLEIPKEQTIKHVNYFTVEYDTVLPEFNNNNKGDVKEKVELVDTDTDKVDLDKVVTNCRYCAKIFGSSFKVRTAVNENSEGGTTNSDMDPTKASARGSVTVNFDGLTIHEEPNEGVAGMTESRTSTEYTPVKHHWFYRVDVEDKSIWRGFSVVDSRALETSYLSPDLNEQTLVPTDGGRYDVNVVGRLRIPVYWNDKPTNVRRCSWFYKGTTDARYVPYTEPVAEKLEEEYRHGMTTGEWHRRLVLPNGEVVVMHGPSVMVHFLHSDTAFSTPPLFSFGKRVYRNPPKIRVSRDQPEKIDHLILLVHGAGEFKCQREKIQSSSRPRVVRRGHDESEIEDTEPSSIDHLLLLCHGVGSACDMRFRSVEEVVEDFRSTSLQLIQSHYRNSYDQGIVSRVEVLPISWHATLHSGETGVDRRLAQITLDSIPRLRSFTNDTVLDVLFYTSPVFCQTIINTVCKELNRIYELFIKRNPNFKGGVSLGGHSLGSVILYDLLCHQTADHISTDDASVHSEKRYVRGSAGTGQPTVQYPSLAFQPAALYALGSPIAIFECIRGVESLGVTFSLPTCKNFFNIFHPYDPIAYRIEPLINPKLRDLKPFLIPHHKGRKRMHLELKDTMARVGADLKQKLLESLKSTWNKWKYPTTDVHLEKVVEEEMEKEQLCDDSKEELMRETELATPEMLGSLNGGRRVDYVLQEAPLEMINEYLFAMSSHVGYWESEDTMLLMLREIYSSLGVQPDCTVPQQNMTVHRTRKPNDETVVVTSADFPSTSHGSI